jgi:hypothetical protein
MTRARMWPAVLPRQIRDSSLRAAEVKVYDLLANTLAKGWVVFYSRPWLGLTPSGEEKDGECDFVVMHPSYGYLTLEVKGGAISYDPSTDQWRSTDRNRIRHSIKNPLRQAVASKHELLRQVKTQKSWPGRFVRQRHGVIFPDTETPPRNLGADGPREIFCCRDDLPNIASWVRDRLSGGNEDDLGADGIRAFEELLASPFLLRVPLGHYLDDDEQTIAALTPQQYHILDAVGHLSRVAAGGGAGTGKTIVAMEDATRLASRSLKTALICHSEPLATHLRERLSRAAPQVGVWSLIELCVDLTRLAGVPYNATSGIEKGIETLLEAVRRQPSLRFDAIIVDEAQDFRTHWWVAIEDLLNDPLTSWLHAYFDTNQSIYGDLAKELASFRIVPVHLTRNLRNTRCIHETASRFYKGIPITADGPEGMQVEWVECQTDQIATRATDAALRLIRGKVSPEDIVILVPEEKMLADIRNRSGFPHRVSVFLIKDFKGLERKAIVLAATRELGDASEMAYVSMSRPRTQLVVVGEHHILSWLRALPTTGDRAD